MRPLSADQIADARTRIAAERERQRVTRRRTQRPEPPAPRDAADLARWAAYEAVSDHEPRPGYDGGEYPCHLPAGALDGLPGLTAEDDSDAAWDEYVRAESARRYRGTLPWYVAAYRADEGLPLCGRVPKASGWCAMLARRWRRAEV